jgi:hypothetical protein
LGLYVLQSFFPQIAIAKVDSVFAQVALVGTFVIAFVVQLGASKITHLIVKGAALIGTSNSTPATPVAK